MLRIKRSVRNPFKEDHVRIRLHMRIITWFTRWILRSFTLCFIFMYTRVHSLHVLQVFFFFFSPRVNFPHLMHVFVFSRYYFLTWSILTRSNVRFYFSRIIYTTSHFRAYNVEMHLFTWSRISDVQRRVIFCNPLSKLRTLNEPKNPLSNPDIECVL